MIETLTIPKSQMKLIIETILISAIVGALVTYGFDKILEIYAPYSISTKIFFAVGYVLVVASVGYGLVRSLLHFCGIKIE